MTRPPPRPTRSRPCVAWPDPPAQLSGAPPRPLAPSRHDPGPDARGAGVRLLRHHGGRGRGQRGARGRHRRGLHGPQPGHLLVVPRRHAVGLDDIDRQTSAHVWSVGQDMARALRRSRLRCPRDQPPHLRRRGRLPVCLPLPPARHPALSG
ncbi:HIT domain-containing protein [Nocardioides ochotonae]|uniref:HIT domain-containing protein n=1 Tax=Nocardioides ochotonae TaxID=2685869 RepID=UPI0037C55EC0